MLAYMMVLLLGAAVLWACDYLFVCLSCLLLVLSCVAAVYDYYSHFFVYSSRARRWGGGRRSKKTCESNNDK